jgi:putative hydrolase
MIIQEGLLMWKVIADLHTHSRYSGGTGSVADNAKMAEERGLEILGMAEHGPANWGHGTTTSLADFDRLIEECRSVTRDYSKLKVLAGTEADIISYQGDLDIPKSLQKKLDQVLAGFHVTVKPKDFKEGVRFASDWVLAKLGPELRLRARNANTKAIVEAVYRNHIDCITHPGLGISIDTYELARACASRETALEINAKHGVKSIAFVQAAAGEGARFMIGSDAHEPGMVGRLEAGVQAAQQAGLRVEQVLNVREIPDTKRTR